MGTEPWLEDASLRSLAWRGDKSDSPRSSSKRLKIGVMWDDGIVKPQPPVMRALQEVVAKVKGIEEVEVFEWKAYKHAVAWDIIVSMDSIHGESTNELIPVQERLFLLEGDKQIWDLINSIGEPWRQMLSLAVKQDPNLKHRNLTRIKALAERRDQYRLEYNKSLEPP